MRNLILACTYRNIEEDDRDAPEMVLAYVKGLSQEMARATADSLRAALEDMAPKETTVDKPYYHPRFSVRESVSNFYDFGFAETVNDVLRLNADFFAKFAGWPQAGFMEQSVANEGGMEQPDMDELCQVPAD